jgi:hypothetical protein
VKNQIYLFLTEEQYEYAIYIFFIAWAGEKRFQLLGKGGG